MFNIINFIRYPMTQRRVPDFIPGTPYGMTDKPKTQFFKINFEKISDAVPVPGLAEPPPICIPEF